MKLKIAIWGNKMKYEDEYNDWAQDYDKFGKITDISFKEQEFLNNVFKLYNVKTVLDCACGTGTHLYMLTKLGYRICGSDYSSAMLSVCKNNLDKEGISVLLKQADFRYLEDAWDENYDAVICMTQAIAHMHTDEDLIMALSSMHNKLNDGGILVLTQGTSHRTLQDKYRFDLVINNRDFSRVYARDIKDGFQTVNILDIYHSENESKMKKHSVFIKILLDDDYRYLLEKAGFSKIDIYGDYEMNTYEKDVSWKIIVVAQK